MALIDCPECKHKISDQSTSCPRCGFPTRKAEHTNKSNTVAEPEKNTKAQILKILATITILSFLYLIISSYFSYKEKAKQYGQKNFSEQVDSSYIPIPMLLTGAGENGHYFLISHITNNGIEEIKYVRKDNVFDSYGKMEIKCSGNEIRKYSANSLSGLQSDSIGEWYKISPEADWTDQDIVNLVCGR